MLNTLKRIATTALVLAAVSASGHAQSVTQGAITGTIEDPTGAVVPSATVTIRNTGTDSTVILQADAKGYFNAPLLQPGEYEVSIKAPGFADYTSTHVLVQVSQSTSLLPHLSAQGTQATVTVEAGTPTVNFESPDFTDVIDNHAIVAIPENNRRWSSLALLTPGVVSDSNGFGLISIRGISPLLNNVEIDGADDNQAYFSEERGRTREAYSTSEDAVQELTVNTGVYAAEYGRAAGGVINSVTKSGTNQLHGELYGYDRESNWSAYTPLVTQTTQNAAGTFVTSPLKPKDLRKIFGFAVGGAIIKDKLFFYYTFDEHKHIFPGNGAPANAATFFTTPDLNLPMTSGGVQESCDLASGLVYAGSLTTLTSATQVGSTIDNQTCALAAREKLASYNAGALAYTAGLSSLLPDLGKVARIGDQEINTPKLDFQINQKQRLSVLYHRLRWDSPGGVQTQAVVPYSTDAFGNDFVKLDYGLAKLETIVTPSISNELGYQYSRELDYETQQPFTAYTLNNLTAGGNSTYVNLATTSGFNLGSPYYSYRAAYPFESKWQVFDTAYYVKGNHTIKFGADILHNYDLINNTFESNGAYNYTYIGNYFSDLQTHLSGAAAANCNTGASSTATVTVKAGVGTINPATGTSPCYNTYVQGYGSPLFDDDTLDYGFFAQDNWKVTPRLTVEFGVRYDYEQLPNPNTALTTASGTFVPYTGITNRPSDKNNIGPRIGFAYDPFGGGTTVLRGGYGLYYGRINNGTILNAFLNTGSPLGQYTTTFKPTTAGHPLLPSLTATGVGAAPAAPTSVYFASNFQNPQIHEFDLILQQELGSRVTVNVSYLGALGRELPNFLDLNLDPTSKQLDTVTFVGGGPIPTGTAVQVPVYTKYGNQALFGTGAANFQAITQITSNVNSSYHALVGEVKTKNFHGLQLDASYTWSHALDYVQNASTSTSGNSFYDPYTNARSNYGNSNYNVPNRITGYFLYDFPNMTGHNFVKYLVNDWSFNDSFQLQSGLPYSAGLNGTVNGGILGGINGSGGVTFIPSSVLGYAGLGRNAYKLKRDITDDIRLVKGFAITERYHLELRGDFFNIANHQNVTTAGATAYSFSSTGTAASNATFNPTTFGVPSSINSSGFLYTPREVQISARFTF